jgi:hypothetical protein
MVALESPWFPLDTEDTMETFNDELTADKAVDAIDSRRERVARGMESAASSLRERADRLPGGERLAQPVRSAAGAMETAADYLRDRDAREMLEDAGEVVGRHPGAALLTAAAVGFLLARALARD